MRRTSFIYRAAVVGVSVLVMHAREAPAQRDSSTIRWLPTRYLSDRFALAPVSPSGDTILFYLDTGGSANMFWG